MKLLTVEDCENLDMKTVWDNYKQFVNPGQVNLISTFGFGRDLAQYAEGAWIYTKSGRKVLDFTGGVGVLSHGHNHPRILAARRRYQELKRMEVHKNFFSPYIAGLSRNLANILPGGLDISYFPNSGSEAVEGAIKMAYKYHDGKRKHILHADISFHGKLLGSASVTGSPELDYKFPRISGTESFQYNDIGSIRKKISSIRTKDGGSDIYALILEPFNASSLRACDEAFLRSVREICDQEDIVLIFDEVYTGWAKTGTLFYFMRHEGLVPDILIFAKSFGGGKASIAGYSCKRPVFMKAYGNLGDATLHSTTYNGFGEETITAIEAVNIIMEEDYSAKAARIYNRINPGLIRLKEKYPHIIEDVRGAGSLNGILLKADSAILKNMAKIIPSKMFKDERFFQKALTGALINRLYDKHSILTFYGSNREIPLIISPSLVIKDEEIDHFLESLDSTLSEGLAMICADFIKSKFFSVLLCR
ncbi:aspartate aminotransferase family protein [Elusimicrobiota bacterium]